jgi:tetratricopeptide (TPR) repeat protein
MSCRQFLCVFGILSAVLLLAPPSNRPGFIGLAHAEDGDKTEEEEESSDDNQTEIDDDDILGNKRGKRRRQKEDVRKIEEVYEAKPAPTPVELPPLLPEADEIGESEPEPAPEPEPEPEPEEYARPIALANAVGETDKEEAGKQMELAGLYGKAGHPDAQMEALKAAVTADPDNCSYQMALGVEYLGRGMGTEAVGPLKTSAELFEAWDSLSLEERKEIDGEDKDKWKFKNPLGVSPALLWEQSSVFQEALPESVVEIPLIRGGPGNHESFVEITLPDESTHLFRLGWDTPSTKVTQAFVDAAGAKATKRKIKPSSEYFELAKIPSFQLGDLTIEGLWTRVESDVGEAGGLPLSGTLGLRGVAEGLAFAVLPSEGVLLLGKAATGPEMLDRAEGAAQVQYESHAWSKESDGRKREWNLISHPWLFTGTANGVETTFSILSDDNVGLSRNLTADWDAAWSFGTSGGHAVELQVAGGAFSWSTLAAENTKAISRRHPEGVQLGAAGLDIAVDPSSKTLAIAWADGDKRGDWFETAIANALEEPEEEEEETFAPEEEEAEEEEAEEEDTGPRVQSSGCFKASAYEAWAEIANGEFDKVMKRPVGDEQMNAMMPTLVGNAMLIAGVPESAEAAYRQAIRLEGRKATLGLGIVQFEQGKHDLALKNLEYGVWSSPGNLQRANLYAEALALGLGMGAAVDTMTRLSAAFPDNPTWALAQARTQAMVGQDSTDSLKRTLGLYEASMGLAGSAEMKGQYAMALVLAERYEEASQVADAALAASPRSASAVLALSEIAAKEGNFEFANQLRTRAAMSHLDDPAYAALLKP